LREHL